MKLTEIQNKVAQLYRLPLTEDNLQNAKPGQFVVSGNDSEVISGFVKEINYNNNYMELCLFHPASVPSMATVIKTSMSMDECALILKQVLKTATPEINEQWVEVLKNAVTLH